MGNLTCKLIHERQAWRKEAEAGEAMAPGNEIEIGIEKEDQSRAINLATGKQPTRNMGDTEVTGKRRRKHDKNQQMPSSHALCVGRMQKERVFDSTGTHQAILPQMRSV